MKAEKFIYALEGIMNNSPIHGFRGNLEKQYGGSLTHWYNM